jgi:hypothetical protein
MPSQIGGFDNTLVSMGGPSSRQLSHTINTASRFDRAMRIEMEAGGIAEEGDNDSLHDGVGGGGAGAEHSLRNLGGGCTS